jgi:hypothetical protein
MLNLMKLPARKQYVGTKSLKLIAGWGDVPTNASPAPKLVPVPADRHRNRSAATATAGWD